MWGENVHARAHRVTPPLISLSLGAGRVHPAHDFSAVTYKSAHNTLRMHPSDAHTRIARALGHGKFAYILKKCSRYTRVCVCGSRVAHTPRAKHKNGRGAKIRKTEHGTAAHNSAHTKNVSAWNGGGGSEGERICRRVSPSIAHAVRTMCVAVAVRSFMGGY